MEWARTTAGYSIDDAAGKLGVRVRRVMEWEEGVRSPTMPQARLAAHVYQRPLAVFFLPEPPNDPTTPPDFRSLPGEGARVTTPDLRHALRVAEHRRETAIELDPDARQSISGLIGSLSTNADPETVAAAVRAQLNVRWTDQLGWGTNYQALNSWRAAVESLGVLVFRFSAVPVDVARGFSIGGRIYPVISLNSADGPAARVFTLIHELGHLLVGTGGVCDLDERGEPPSAEASAGERFCNQLAAAVLMPAEDLRTIPVIREAGPDAVWNLASLQDAANTIHVSQHALLIRLKEIGRTSEAGYLRTLSDLRASTTGRTSGGFELVPEAAIREVGAPFARLVLAAYQGEAITARDLAEYLGVRFKHVPRIQDLLDTANA
jgi:Zn-dependent peptidase ImmA (M78 family)/transcriptional regulator with XRE-family HTH domain